MHFRLNSHLLTNRKNSGVRTSCHLIQLHALASKLLSQALLVCSASGPMTFACLVVQLFKQGLDPFL